MEAVPHARISTTDKDQNPEVQLSKLCQYCQDLESQTIAQRVEEGMEYAKRHGTKTGIPGIGRKSLSIPFAIVCKRVKESLRDNGKPWGRLKGSKDKTKRKRKIRG